MIVLGRLAQWRRVLRKNAKKCRWFKSTISTIVPMKIKEYVPPRSSRSTLNGLQSNPVIPLKTAWSQVWRYNGVWKFYNKPHKIDVDSFDVGEYFFTKNSDVDACVFTVVRINTHVSFHARRQLWLLLPVRDGIKMAAATLRGHWVGVGRDMPHQRRLVIKRKEERRGAKSEQGAKIGMRTLVAKNDYAKRLSISLLGQ